MMPGATENLAATTIDELFREAAAGRPDAIALTDPPNRESFTDGIPRRLTFAQADRAISAIAAKLRQIGLPTDSFIGIALPNTVESVLTILAVLRAGMIAVPLPLLWRRTEIAGALSRIGAKAIVTSARVGNFQASAVAVQVASDLFGIRHVCGFGRNLPDGVIPLDPLMDDQSLDRPPNVTREGDPSAYLAMVSFDVTPDGIIAVARNHAELIAGGLAAVLEGGIEANARLLGSLALGSFAGMSLTLMPWLLSGGTLSLHHGFDADAFAIQCSDERCDTAILPGALVPQLAEARLLAHADLKTVLAAWRSPERFLASSAWEDLRIALTDIVIFGEIGLVGLRRQSDGLPLPLPSGTAKAPSGSASAVPIAAIVQTEKGTLALRGAMVPHQSFFAGASRETSPPAKVGPKRAIDTFYPCRTDEAAGTATVTGPQPGMVSVGAYRFVLSELQDTVRRAHSGASVTAFPDALAGHRLAGVSSGRDELVRLALDGLGVNPLLIDAFQRDRH
jgi:hypothetical protein